MEPVRLMRWQLAPTTLVILAACTSAAPAPEPERSSTNDEPASANPPPEPPSAATTDALGQPASGAVKAVIGERIGALQTCYEHALLKAPGLQGRTTYTIAIGSRGTVTDVDVEEDTVGSPVVLVCAKGEITGWRFPTRETPETDHVTFSVVFSGSE